MRVPKIMHPDTFHAGSVAPSVQKLKAENQMLWVGKMNTIREAATEIVNNDLIYS